MCMCRVYRTVENMCHLCLVKPFSYKPHAKGSVWHNACIVNLLYCEVAIDVVNRGQLAPTTC